MFSHKNIYGVSSQYNKVRDLLIKGIGFHHAGLFPILKEITEEIFKLGLGKVLFCTETYAAGVNCPAKTVVFMKLSKYSKNGNILVPSASYKQMAGRAGRRGLDTNGEVIILFDEIFPDEDEIKIILTGNIPEIKSKLKFDYQFYLRVVLSDVMDIKTFYKKSLSNEENEIIMTGLLKQKTELEKNLKNINFQDLNDNKEIIKLIDYENKIKNNNFGNYITISLNKKEQKEFNNLQKKLTDQNFKKKYESFISHKNIIFELDIIDKQINYISTYVENKCCYIKKLLFKWGYVATDEKMILNKSDINIKGVIAGNINECNPILLTEVISGDYLDDLSVQEIVAFVSIFGNPIKASFKYNSVDMENFNGTLLLKKKVQQFLLMKEIKENDEDCMLCTYSDKTNWEITTHYIDLAYKWANGASVNDILRDVSIAEEGEGDFVKNMLKIENIIGDIIMGCKIMGKIELLPILEKTTGVIIRDIVSVSSLYL
jgi:superfamily II RNA helicase